MNLKELLLERGVDFVEGGSHRHVREGWIGLDCPWCGTVGKYHLGIHLSSLSAHCWRCGRKSVAEVVASVVGCSFRQARRLVSGMSRFAEASEREDRGVRGELRVPAGVGPLQEPHRRWLESRGLDPDRVERLWGLRGIGLSARLPWSIWVPVHLDGRTVSWTTRAIGPAAGRRWVHANPDEEVLPIKSTLYGWDYVRSAAIVVEGASDVWRIGPGAVALFGTSATSSQLRLLSAVPRRIVCLDSEPAAQRAARALADSLGAFPGETLVVELSSPDPGEATDDEVMELRKFLG